VTMSDSRDVRRRGSAPANSDPSRTQHRVRPHPITESFVDSDDEDGPPLPPRNGEQLPPNNKTPPPDSFLHDNDEPWEHPSADLSSVGTDEGEFCKFG